MKVLMFTPYFQKEYGSHEYYLVKHLSKMGHDVVLVTSKHPYPKYERNYKRIILTDDSVNGVKILRLDSYFQIKGVPLLKDIEKLIEKERPDVVHIHDHFQWYSYKLSTLKKKYGYRLILTQHLYKLPRQKISIPIFWLIDRIFGNKTIEESDKIIAISPSQKEFLLKRTTKNKIVEIPTGIDTSIFHNVKNTRSLKKKLGIKKQKVILSVTRFTKHKDVSTLIKALGELEKKIDFLCIIIGSGPLEPQIKKEIAEMGLDTKVKIINYVEQKELPKYYSIADVFVLPSIEEPFGIVLLEALACDTPAIGSDVKSIRNILKDEPNIIFEIGNYIKLSKKIEYNIKKKKEYPIEVLNQTKDSYDWKMIVKRISSLYGE